VCTLLVLGAGVNLWLWLEPQATHQTLPIFTLVSLEMERAMRKGPGRRGEEAVCLAQKLADEPTLDPALKGDEEALRAARTPPLDLHNQRHALNARLREVGVEVGSQLTAEQWAVATMQRDSLRRDGDEAVFDRLQQELSTPQSPERVDQPSACAEAGGRPVDPTGEPRFAGLALVEAVDGGRPRGAARPRARGWRRDRRRTSGGRPPGRRRRPRRRSRACGGRAAKGAGRRGAKLRAEIGRAHV
jgi:hypothetical protein